MTLARYVLLLVFVFSLSLVTGCQSNGTATSAAPADTTTGTRQRLTFNAGWRFTRGDPDGAQSPDLATFKPYFLRSAAPFTKKPTTAPVAAASDRPDVHLAYAQAAFDDSAWRQLDLPHDFGIEGPFQQELPGETGKLPWAGVAWYRKHFTLPASDAGKKIYLDVDGAMSYATVWCNGQFAGGWPYGYASWRVDLTPHLKPGGADNVIAVRLDNPRESSRWYPGGGIYRNVWLTKTNPVHVAQWGTFVTTPEVTKDSATVNVRVELDAPAGAKDAQIATAIYELKDDRRAGAAVATSEPVSGHTTANFNLKVANPKLWDLQHRNRYVAVTTVKQAGRIVDEYETRFGIRTARFDPAKGFLLNGAHVPIRGVCNHHDLGALGSAINVRAIERQIEILQEMGCNAIRTSHNPPAPELLELCDRMGMLVMDEAFDCWAQQKKRNDYHLLFPDFHEADLRALVRRDRNHPCVILWSIGNEIREQGSKAGPTIAAALTAIVHDEDPTRPTTSACNNGSAGYNGFQTGVDVFGDNYQRNGYAKFTKTHPDQPFHGSETASTVSSRGEYFFPVVNDKLKGRSDFQVSSYDLYAPPWAYAPDVEFKALDENPSVAGEFVWTGFDYLGEPTPYNADSTNLLNFTSPQDQARVEKELKELGKIKVPSRSSYFGIVDLAGLKKDRFYLYQARWRPDLPMVHVLPHWNWPDRAGQVTPVHVYTSGDEVELFLNGQSLGRKKKGPLEYRVRFDDVTYAPGMVRAVAYREDKKWAEETVKTTGPAAKLSLTPDRKQIRADGYDLSYVTIAITDKEGLTVPRSKNTVRLSITGPAEIVATDNGDATSFVPFQSKEHPAFNGLLVAIVRSKPGAAGTVKLTAESDGLQSATVTLTTKSTP